MKRIMAIAIVSAVASTTMADTVDVRYTGIAGGSNASKLRVEGGNYYAGHMNHEFTSGDRAGETFSTFCIDFSESARTNGATYQIVDIADAPMPGTPYGQEIANKINAVVANAAALGWIDGKLGADTQQTGYLAKMGAIQAAVWEAFGSNVNITSRRTSNDLESYYNILMNQQTFDSSMRMNGLRAIVAEGQQDMLYVVPLPPAAFAGLGMLGTIAGVRTIRRRK
jgi:Thioester domain